MASSDENPIYRYVVLLSCFTTVFLTGGVSYANAGLYQMYWLDFDEDSAKIATIGSLSFGLCSLLGPVASLITNIIGHRPAIIVGCLVSTVAMVVSAFASDTNLILIAYGITAGSAWCVGYIPAYMAAPHYFPARYHGIVIGIISSAMGLGPFVLPVFVGWLNDIYTWRGALIVQAGLNLNQIACAMTLIDKLPRSKQNFMRLDLLKDAYFVNICLAGVLAGLGLSVIFIHIAAVVETFLGLDTFQTSLVMTALGLGNFLGRLGHGIISSHRRVNVIYQYSVSMAVMGVLTGLLTVTKSLALVTAMCAVIGLCIGVFGTIPSILITRITEATAWTSAFGYHNLSIGFGLSLGAPLAGWLYDSTGQYTSSMYLGGAMLIAAAAIKVVFIRQWNRHFKRCMKTIIETPGGEAEEADVRASLVSIPEIT